MVSARRLIGILVTVLVVASLTWAIVTRMRDSGDGEAGRSPLAEVPEGGSEQVSSAQTFATDVPIPVEGKVVVRDTLVISVAAAAQSAAFKEARLLAQVEGRVTRVLTEENTPVRRGSQLIEIDSTEYALSVSRARAQLAKADAAFRELILFDDQIADSAIRTERARVARAKSGLEDAEFALREAELRLSRTRVSAPFAGRVASLRVVEGQTVRVGDELVSVVDLDPIKVEVQVLESEVGLLRQGNRAAATFAAFPGERFVGRVATINPVVERNTRTARVTVTLPNRDGRILPGMYARVSIEARQFADRVLVPRAAILERDRRTMLFVFTGEEDVGLAKWRYVTTGLGNDSVVEVVENAETDMVQPGEWVLTDGHYTLIHDARVRLVQSTQGEEGGRPR
jgi:HlyD family secretion protein